MIKHNQNGKVAALAIWLGVVSFVLVGVSALAGWAVVGRQDYKNNVDQKIGAAVTVAVQKEDGAKDVAFAEAEKKPLRTYNGPETYGSIHLSYPKTWSGYVDDTGHSSALVDGYFYPGIVPSLMAQSSLFAVRVRVVDQPYAQVITTLEGQQLAGKLTISAYALPKVPKAIGIKAVGLLPTNVSGQMVLLPLRNQTVEISTEGALFVNDFETNILPNFTFAP
jgi:hypothetical protein